MLVKINFGTKKIRSKKRFGPKKIWSKKRLGPKRILVRKKCWSKEFLVREKILVQKNFSPAGGKLKVSPNEPNRLKEKFR